MQFIQASPDNDKCWFSKDAANLRFFGPCPTQFTAKIIGHCGQAGDKVQVPTEELALIGQAHFGAPRPSICAGVTWSGDSHSFGIYRYRHNRVAIIEVNGAGHFVYLIDQTEADKTWTKLCEIVPTELLWDLCRTITGTAEKSANDMRAEMTHLFICGRLKKRMHKGCVLMDILPPKHA